MKLSNDDSIKIKHGKTSKNSRGYYYEGPRGQQLYRDRPETYQQKRSPKQRWNSLAFTYAHQQIRQIWSNQQQIDQVTQEWQAACVSVRLTKPIPTQKAGNSLCYKSTGKLSILSKPGTNNTSQKYPRKPQRKLLPRILPTICFATKQKSSKPKPLNSAPNSKHATNNSFYVNLASMPRASLRESIVATGIRRSKGDAKNKCQLQLALVFTAVPYCRL